jgi:nudix-type nucleoside diphosphatase (YffH/AdpP family)
MAEDARPEIVGVQPIHDGFVKFGVATVRLADGTVLRREIEDHGDAVAVLPYDPERRIGVLVRLFRPPLLYRGAGFELTEAPAGLIDPGETPEATAKREAEEEAGVVLGELERVATVWSSPGVSTEQITLFLAPCSTADRSEGGGKSGEHENITVLEVSLRALWARAEAGGIEDMKLLALVQALRIRRPELFEA